VTALPHRRVVRWVAIFGCASALTLWGAAPQIPEEVKTTIRQRVNYGYCPAVIVGLRNSEGAAYFAYGQTERGGGRAVDEHTLFEMGSVTKVFTATVLADMAQHGELALTDPAQQYVPPGIHVPTRQGKSITLTHLASHTSGLPSAPSNLSPTDGNNPFAGYTAEAMYAFLNGYTLTRNPGALYEYSNFGAGLLGHLLAHLAQTDYETLIQRRVSAVLGLPDTRIRLTAEQRERLARGYSGVLPIPEFEMGALEGAGALRSSAADLMAFLAANRGWVESPLLPAMTEAHRARAATPTAGLSIGLGWHLLTLSRGTAVWHDGATIGHRAFVGFLRDGNALAVALANSDYATIDIGFHLLDPASPLSAVRQPAAVPIETLRHYVGRYERTVQDHFVISLVEDHLVLRYSADQGRGLTLHPSSRNVFYLTFPEAQGSFSTNAAGRATALVWTQSGQSNRYPKVRQNSGLLVRRGADGLDLQITGDTDREYLLEASSNLREWSIISTNTIWDTPITDREAGALDRRFYRLREP
jgi:CubicO group peptidase (beta-lactamase class C family)